MFPDPYGGDEDGCIAIGGDLSVDRLLLAYTHGIFPWYAYKREAYGDQLKDGEPVPIQWFCPLERFVFFPDRVHISRSTRRFINKTQDLYEISFNNDFEGVINSCAEVHGGDDFDWLGPDMIEAYTELHRQGYAHSIEVWNKQTGKLVGGLYGLMLGRIFYAESMFHKETNTSKLAFYALCAFMVENHGMLIDSQVENSHTKSLGGVTISYREYMEILNEGLYGKDE